MEILSQYYEHHTITQHNVGGYQHLLRNYSVLGNLSSLPLALISLRDKLRALGLYKHKHPWIEIRWTLVIIKLHI